MPTAYSEWEGGREGRWEGEKPIKTLQTELMTEGNRRAPLRPEEAALQEAGENIPDEGKLREEEP